MRSVISVAVKPGANHIGSNVVLRQFQRQHLRECDQPALAGGIVCLTEVSRLTNKGSDVDDSAEVPLDHERQRGAGAIKGTVEIGINDLSPVAVRHLANALIARDSSVVHKNVDLLVNAKYFLDQISSFEPI